MITMYAGRPIPKNIPYWKQRPTPVCPEIRDKPEYPDGWYWVKVRSDGQDGEGLLRRKSGTDAFQFDGEPASTYWSIYEVIASLEGVKFLYEEK